MGRAKQVFGRVEDGDVSVASTDTGKTHRWTLRCGRALLLLVHVSSLFLSMDAC